MNRETTALEHAARELQRAARERKCWRCGCLHEVLASIERGFGEEVVPAPMGAAVASARARLTPVEYDCIGCDPCFPPLAMDALALEDEVCPSECATERAGWPPLAGDYAVLRYRAPVAVCTLIDAQLSAALLRTAGPEVGIVGTLQTENLGIERLVRNVIANPHLRFLVLCGPDSSRELGHHPGQSLSALVRAGVDGEGRIVGATGRRPRLRNVSEDALDHFRRTIELVDLTRGEGARDAAAIAGACAACGERDPGPAMPFDSAALLAPVPARLPERAVLDPAGYVVLFPDRARGLLSLEHYTPDGVLDAIVEGERAEAVCATAIERGLVTRLDHAAYLGRELERAERALRTGEPYVQDRAPERPQHPPGCCGPGPRPDGSAAGST